MSGFTFNPPNTDSQPPADPPPGDVITFDGWWPDIHMTTVRQAVTIGSTVTADRLRESVRLAMLDVARELATWRQEQQALGFTALQQVPARAAVDGISDYVMLWNRAICSVVAADIGERQLTAGLTRAGADRADELLSDVDLHQRNVRIAVRDFLGRTRARVALV